MRIKWLGSLLTVWAIVLFWQAPAFGADGYQETVPDFPGQQQLDTGCSPDLLVSIWRTMGYACFFAYGDDFYLIDEASDGRSIAVQWRLTDGSRSGLIRDKLGYNVHSMRKKDFPEGAILKWRMGRCDQTPTNDCHQAGDYTNWGVVDGTNYPAFCTPVNGASSHTDPDVDVCAWP